MAGCDESSVGSEEAGTYTGLFFLHFTIYDAIDIRLYGIDGRLYLGNDIGDCRLGNATSTSIDCPHSGLDILQ